MEKQELMPMQQIREMVKNGQIKDNELVVETSLEENFKEFINEDQEVKEGVKKHHKKTFNLFKKRKEAINKDVADTDVYKYRYDKEEWFYKRHKDTIDKYVKKEDKKPDKKDTDTLVATINNNNDDVILRIGLFKMLLIVWFDIFVDSVGKIVFFPIHLLRYVSELFFKMKKSIAITIIIIVAIVVVVVGLVFGIGAIMDYAKAIP